MQFVSNIVGLELRVARRADRAARGAALMGRSVRPCRLMWRGFTHAEDDIVYRRQMTVEEAQARYAGWLRAVSQVLCGQRGLSNTLVEE